MPVPKLGPFRFSSIRTLVLYTFVPYLREIVSTSSEVLSPVTVIYKYVPLFSTLKAYDINLSFYGDAVIREEQAVGISGLAQAAFSNAGSRTSWSTASNRWRLSASVVVSWASN